MTHLTDSKHTKPMTKLYIEHACNHIGTNQTANLLNIEASRVSEMKSGRRRMTVEEGEVIRAEFGLPCMDPGIYVKGEMLGQDWQTDYKKNGEILHLSSALEAIRSEKLIEVMLNICYIDTRLIEGYKDTLGLFSDERESVELENQRREKEAKLAQLQRLIASHEFQSWRADKLREIECRTYPNLIPLLGRGEFAIERDNPELMIELNQICSIVTQGLSIRDRYLDKFAFPIINAIGAIYYVINNGVYVSQLGSCAEFKLNKSIPLLKHSPQQEYVFMGKSVWQSDNMPLLEPRNAESGLGWMPDLSIHHEPELDIKPGKYIAANFQIIYTEQHKYYVRVNFCKHEHGLVDRTIVIPVKNSNKVFDEISLIFEEFQPRLGISLDDLKKSLAQNGAYIPSAVYIE